MSLYDQIQSCVQAIGQRASLKPQVGVILGSGLGSFAEEFLEDRVSIPYSELPHFPQSSVVGHAGTMVLGTLKGEPVVALQGRVHYYEGYTPAQVAFPARVLCAMGIRALVVTNASGSIRADYPPGQLMAMVDHVNLSGFNALHGPNDERLGPRFPDLTTAYDPGLLALLEQVAAKTGVSLAKGVYAMVSGPTYETPAEVRMLRLLGADAVGMSTVPEVVAAAHMGVKLAGISCLTNLAAGIGAHKLTHKEVAETAHRMRGVFGKLLAEFLPAAAKV